MKKVKRIHCLIATDSDDEILIDLATLVDWTILPKCFPRPMDREEREPISKEKAEISTMKGSTRVNLSELKQEKDSEKSKLINNDQESSIMEFIRIGRQLKQSLPREFEEVFMTECSVFDSIGEMAEKDTKYNQMLFHLANQTPIKNMELDCELRKMQGKLKDMSIYKTSSGKQLIFNNSLEVLIPKSGKEKLLGTFDTHPKQTIDRVGSLETNTESEDKIKMKPNMSLDPANPPEILSRL